jgi:methylated-DNA-[protein]-cysteine S-methyltransferase
MKGQSSQCIFETPLGVCGIAWTMNGGQALVVGFRLPEVGANLVPNPAAEETTAPPPSIASIIERVRRHLAGELQDFRDIAVALKDTDAFARRVYQATREILAGQTQTYGDIAKTLGQPHAAQAVGQALGSNPIPLIIPCHRVLAAGGKLGGFSAPGGRASKERLLEIERARFPRSLFGGRDGFRS